MTGMCSELEKSHIGPEPLWTSLSWIYRLWCSRFHISHFGGRSLFDDVEVTQLAMEQSIEAGLSDTDTVRFEGTVVAKNGR